MDFSAYPHLIKFFPDWLERFYPHLAQFARGEGYPCGNQGVFIPRRNRCWTHPKTGQRLKKPLTYQMYKDAKEKSQRSRTEKGRTALETREQGFRDKAREKVKGWQKNKPEAEVVIKVGAKQVNIVGSSDLYKELNLTHDPSLGWQVTNKNGDVLRQPKNGNLQPSHRFKEKSQAENFAKQVIAKVNRMTGKPATKSEPKQTPNSTGVKGTGGKTFDLDNLWRQTADAAYSKNKDGVSKNLEQWRQVVKKLESGEGISKDVNLNEYEKLMDNLEKKLVLDPKDPSNVEFKKITGSIYRTLDKAIRRDPLTQEDLEKAHPNFRPIMQRMNKTFTKHNELGDKKRLLEKELDRLKNERSYNESVILNNSKQFRETSIDNNYNELKALVKRNPNDLIDIKNPVSNLPERTVSVSKRIDEINKDIRDLADDGKAQIIQEQAKKEIARLQTPIKDTENRVSSLANEIKSLRESRGEATKSETKQTPNSSGESGKAIAVSTPDKKVEQKYKDIIASSKDPKGTEKVLREAMIGGALWKSQKQTYKESLEEIEGGIVPEGYENHVQGIVDRYKPVIDAENFINKRREAVAKGDFRTKEEAELYVGKKIQSKSNKPYDYFDSPEYGKEYEKIKSVMKSDKLPPPLSGVVPSKELKQTTKQGDQLLYKKDTYSLMSGGNSPTGYEISDTGEVVGIGFKNVKTRSNSEYMGRLYENEGTVPLDKISHIIRDGKRYKVDPSDSSPNDLGIPESSKPRARKRAKKNDFNSSQILAQFGSGSLRRRKSKQTTCCCNSPNSLRRRKSKQTAKLRRGGNRYV